jgi:hypothetical protein
MSRQQITDMVRTTKKRSNGLVKFPHQGLEIAGLIFRDGNTRWNIGIRTRTTFAFRHWAEAKALKQPSRGVALRPSFAEIGFTDFWPLATAPKPQNPASGKQSPQSCRVC